MNGFWGEADLNMAVSSAVPTEGSYFTSSRVRGKRGIIKEVAVTLRGPEDNTLLFESRFESGNLQKAVRVWVSKEEFPTGMMTEVTEKCLQESGVFSKGREVIRNGYEDEEEWNNCDSYFSPK